METTDRSKLMGGSEFQSHGSHHRVNVNVAGTVVH